MLERVGLSFSLSLQWNECRSVQNVMGSSVAVTGIATAKDVAKTSITPNSAWPDGMVVSMPY